MTLRVLTLALFTMMIVGCTEDVPDQPPPLPQSTTSSPPIETVFARGTELRLTGRQAATTDISVPLIDLWETTAGTRSACQLPHGTDVLVLDTARPAGAERWYYRVEGDDCAGWVTGNFLEARGEVEPTTPSQPGT